jgi:hypothetical protein
MVGRRQHRPAANRPRIVATFALVAFAASMALAMLSRIRADVSSILAPSTTLSLWAQSARRNSEPSTCRSARDAARPRSQIRGRLLHSGHGECTFRGPPPCRACGWPAAARRRGPDSVGAALPAIPATRRAAYGLQRRQRQAALPALRSFPVKGPDGGVPVTVRGREPARFARPGAPSGRGAARRDRFRPRCAETIWPNHDGATILFALLILSRRQMGGAREGAA